MDTIKVKNCTFIYSDELSINGKTITCNVDTVDDSVKELRDFQDNIWGKSHKADKLKHTAVAIPFIAILLGMMLYLIITQPFTRTLLITLILLAALSTSVVMIVTVYKKENEIDGERELESSLINLVNTVRLVKTLKESENKIKRFYIATDESKKPILLVEYDKYSSPVPDALNFVRKYGYNVNATFKNQEIMIDCYNERIMTD